MCSSKISISHKIPISLRPTPSIWRRHRFSQTRSSLSRSEGPATRVASQPRVLLRTNGDRTQQPDQIIKATCCIHYSEPWDSTLKHIAHETAICRNRPIHNFTGHRKKKTPDILKGPAFKHVIFLRKYKGNHFLWIQDSDRSCVCNPTVYLEMSEYQSDGSFGLRQIAVSWAIWKKYTLILSIHVHNLPVHQCRWGL
jgi:hypothetical protein